MSLRQTPIIEVSRRYRSVRCPLFIARDLLQLRIRKNDRLNSIPREYLSAFANATYCATKRIIRRCWRKLHYNLTITLLSTAVALLVGAIEALGLIGEQFGLTGSVWQLVGMPNDNFCMLDYAIVALFIGGWIVSALVYRLKGYDREPI